MCFHVTLVSNHRQCSDLDPFGRVKLHEGNECLDGDVIVSGEAVVPRGEVRTSSARIMLLARIRIT